MTVKIDAKLVQDLLAVKHSKDVYVPECKDGPTWGGAHLRMDGWSMSRSWSNPLIRSYEIKVSRGDFLGDKKMHLYGAYCNEAYLVCPSGMIQIDEVPPAYGLMWVAKTGTRLYTKKKAQYTEIDPANIEPVYRYILMSRATIGDEYTERPSRGSWEEWLQKKKVDREFGRMVSRSVATAVADEIVRVQNENERLRKENARLDSIRKFLDDRGIDPASWDLDEKVRRLVEGKMPRDTEFAIKRAHKALGELMGIGDD